MASKQLQEAKKSELAKLQSCLDVAVAMIANVQDKCLVDLLQLVCTDIAERKNADESLEALRRAIAGDGARVECAKLGLDMLMSIEQCELQDHRCATRLSFSRALARVWPGISCATAAEANVHLSDVDMLCVAQTVRDPSRVHGLIAVPGSSDDASLHSVAANCSQVVLQALGRIAQERLQGLLDDAGATQLAISMYNNRESGAYSAEALFPGGLNNGGKGKDSVAIDFKELGVACGVILKEYSAALHAAAPTASLGSADSAATPLVPINKGLAQVNLESVAFAIVFARLRPFASRASYQDPLEACDRVVAAFAEWQRAVEDVALACATMGLPDARSSKVLACASDAVCDAAVAHTNACLKKMLSTIDTLAQLVRKDGELGRCRCNMEDYDKKEDAAPILAATQSPDAKAFHKAWSVYKKFQRVPDILASQKFAPMKAVVEEFHSSATQSGIDLVKETLCALVAAQACFKAPKSGESRLGMVLQAKAIVEPIGRCSPKVALLLSSFENASQTS